MSHHDYLNTISNQISLYVMRTCVFATCVAEYASCPFTWLSTEYGTNSIGWLQLIPGQTLLFQMLKLGRK